VVDIAVVARNASSIVRKDRVDLRRLFLCGVVMVLTVTKHDALNDIDDFLVLKVA